MMNSRIRRAGPQDATDIARLVDLAGQTTDIDFWTRQIQADGSLHAAARHLILSDGAMPYHYSPYYYSKAEMLEMDGKTVAGGIVAGFRSDATGCL